MLFGRGLRARFFSGGLFVLLVEFLGFLWVELAGISFPSKDDKSDPAADDDGVDDHKDDPRAFFREEGHGAFLRDFFDRAEGWGPGSELGYPRWFDRCGIALGG